MDCKKCGKRIDENKQYCLECESKYELNNGIDFNSLNNRVVIDLNSEKEGSYNEQFCKCGQKLQKDWEFCPNCRTNLTSKTDENILSENSKIKILLILYFVFIICFFALPKKIVCFLISQLIIVTGKIKYPDNKIITIIFIINLTIVIFSLMGVILMGIACVGLINCAESLGG